MNQWWCCLGGVFDSFHSSARLKDIAVEVIWNFRSCAILHLQLNCWIPRFKSLLVPHDVDWSSSLSNFRSRLLTYLGRAHPSVSRYWDGYGRWWLVMYGSCNVVITYTPGKMTNIDFLGILGNDGRAICISFYFDVKCIETPLVCR